MERLLLDETEVLDKADSCTHIEYKFRVPKRVKQLVVSFTYSPKTFDLCDDSEKQILDCFEKYDEVMEKELIDYLPLKNLITVSFDDMNKKYRGAIHRMLGDDELIKISRSGANPGLIPGFVGGGMWRIVLSVHNVSCELEYSVKIKGVC